MKINFTSKDVIKWIIFVFIPLLIISYLIVVFTGESTTISGHLSFSLVFSYPLYLLENLKLKKLFKWIVIGILPMFLLIQTFPEKLDLFSAIGAATGFSYFMYPMTLFFFSTMKDVWEMLKEMNFIQRFIMVSVFLLMMIRILRQW